MKCAVHLPELVLQYDAYSKAFKRFKQEQQTTFSWTSGNVDVLHRCKAAVKEILAQMLMEFQEEFGNLDPEDVEFPNPCRELIRELLSAFERMSNAKAAMGMAAMGSKYWRDCVIQYQHVTRRWWDALRSFMSVYNCSDLSIEEEVCYTIPDWLN